MKIVYYHLVLSYFFCKFYVSFFNTRLVLSSPPIQVTLIWSAPNLSNTTLAIFPSTLSNVHIPWFLHVRQPFPSQLEHGFSFCGIPRSIFVYLPKRNNGFDFT